MTINENKCLAEKEKAWCNRHLKILLILYTVAHFPILALFDARFWDDWSLYKGSPDVVLEIFQQAGSPMYGKLHVALQLFGWWAYPLFTFLAFLSISVFTYKIVEYLDYRKSTAFWIATLVAVIPVNFARAAAIDLPYTLTLTSFMFSWMLLVSHQGKIQLVSRVAILFGFFFSFQTGSLLVLYAAPVFTYFNQRWKHFNSADGARLSPSLIGSIDLMLLPVIYWIFKFYYLTPHGIFSGYNSPSISFTVLMKSFLPIYEFLKGDGIQVGASYFIFIILLLLVTPLSVIQRCPVFVEGGNKETLILVAAGFFISYLGAFPYVAVGKLPSYGDWTSTRHQLTLSIGLSFLLYGVLDFTLKKAKERVGNFREYLPLFFVILFTLNWWAVYAEFYVDHLRQIALVNLIKERPDLKSGNFIFLDSSGFNAFDTKPGLGEYAAIHGEATDLHDSLILDYQSLGKYGGWRPFVDLYGKFLGEWSKTENVNLSLEPSLYIISSKSNIKIKQLFALKMFIYHLFFPEKERLLLQDLLVIDGPFLPNSVFSEKK